MNRRCSCGGTMRPHHIGVNTKLFAKRCDRCKVIHYQRKRLPAVRKGE